MFIAVIKSSAVVASACLIDRVYTHDVDDNVSTAAADRCRTSVECCQRTDEATDRLWLWLRISEARKG